MVNAELERIRKETLVAEWKHHPGICLGGLRNITKTSVSAGGVPNVIRTEDLPITSLDRCRYDNPLGKSDSSVTVNRYVCHDEGGHYFTSREVAGSITDEVIPLFN
jgi:hypothetical protein